MVALAHAERQPGLTREQLILITLVAFIVAYVVYASMFGSDGASPEARERQNNYNDCVRAYLDEHGDTPGNRAIAHSTCLIHFLM